MRWPSTSSPRVVGATVSRENAESVRRSLEAVPRRDYDAALAPMAEDVVWDDSYTPGGGVHRGLDGVRAATRSFFGTWDPGTYGSGVEARMVHFQVWTFRGDEAILCWRVAKAGKQWTLECLACEGWGEE
jgi:hypothetical protein